MTAQFSRRLSRRLTHRSRSTSVAIVLLLVAVVALWVAVETVLQQLGRPALLAAPVDVLEIAEEGGARALPAALGGGVLGLALVIIALLPARRARHALADDRMTVIVDDGVLAAGLGRAVADGESLRRDRVRTSVARTRAYLDLTPTSGLPLDRGRATEHATGLLDALAPRPRVRARVRLDPRGVVGS